MKKMMKAIGITILAGSLLVACNNNEEAENNEPVTEEEVTDAENNETDDEGENTENDSESGGGSAFAPGNFEDQLDLKIGDTGQVSSNVGDFELTIESIKFEDEVDNRSAQFEHFYVADVKFKNIGEEAMLAEDMVGIFDITHELSQTGTGTYINQYFDSFEAVSGRVNPGEEISAQLLFDVYGSDEHYIRVNEGLVASNGVKNQVIWTFSESDLD
ncbi:hypothetical protein AJ85_00310 [Alkalihalobacillus alcalophilus ATCC 27647 = CGMCC 1.3604]|uniref:DUF4352 domain-containing protein n=1 Tax=Alkalihalobacillus alcalophilus ATCC 27647 = CGMCC 1.3604 TaxID=1218173 RepID=A0A094XDU3_ALKAL|nr:DUF4352 domain-containing protein [Alkalihalobacillus alcalophilus]KGA96955.1 hypothetical protein BALCAV_0213100 [Alkalihalobacillus alcalophilus ATCC 27647 = CGMCC 1.3604]MED1561346.1 DUF4352 domain-containing protein [Alkalihalobacillus alcalophilus]THG88730.1 hypothetical protein AJ85_00310 [Alkalihalobacillus alcalophilus ATCC 27647 = CGMCC 1.3604]